ncbi:MAG: hypothetical protein JWM89_3178 [Acidimicrobiales bacterium]|nr:hypothetical protein [Acidimicrobiales bacterium]
MRGVRIALLGPLELVDDEGRALEVGGPKQRAVLAALALSPGRVHSLDGLAARVWGHDPPPVPEASLHSYVSGLRRLLEPHRAKRAPAQVLVTRAPGYVLAVDPDDVDVHRFLRLVGEADAHLAARDASAALGAADEAIALWRGDPLGDLDHDPDVVVDIERLTLAWLRARELRVDALLGMGRPGPAGEDAERLTADHPLNERYWALLMTARYRAGRAADALRAFEECRRRLGEEVGLDPGPELRALEAAILDHSLEASGDGRPPLPERTERVPLAGDPLTVEVGAPIDLIGIVIGRDRELSVAFDAVSAARSGAGRVVTIEGEAGVGKTTIAEAAARHADIVGVRTLWGQGVADLGAPALWLWEPVIRDLGVAGSFEDLEGADESEARFRRFADLAQAFREVIVEPTLIVLEDLQWADAGSLQLLRMLAGASAHVPLSIIVTARSPDAAGAGTLDDTLVALGRLANARRLAISPFGATDVAAFLRWAHRPELALRAADVHRLTGGNLFFLAELANVVADGEDLADLAVPHTIRGVVERRLAQLPDADRPLLRLAALAGSRLDVEVVADAAERAPDDVADAFERAVSAELLTADTSEWRFAHDLTRDSLVAGLNPRERAALHRRLAAAIRAVHRDALEPHLDDLARHHFHAAGTAASAEAFAACEAAADRSRARFAYDQAARHRARALAVLPTDPAADRQRHQTLLALTEERRLAGDVAGAADALELALDTARRLDDPASVTAALALLGEPTLWNWRGYGDIDHDVIALLRDTLDTPLEPGSRAELLGALAVELYYGDGPARADQLSSEAVDAARSTGDPARIGRALNNRVIAIWTPEHEPERLAATTESLALAGRGLPIRTEIIARMHRLAIALRFADMATYRDDLERCDRLVDTLAITELDAQRTYLLAAKALLEGSVERAAELAERASYQHRRTSLWGAQWSRLIQRTTSERFHGRVESVVDELLGHASRDEFQVLRPTAALAVAEAGDHERALALVRAWDLRPGSLRRDWLFDFHLAQLGELAALLATPDVEVLYDQLHPLRDRFVVAGTAMACWGSTHATLGRLAAAQGRRDLAIDHLEQARSSELAAGAVGPAAHTSAAIIDLRASPPIGDQERASSADGPEAEDQG